MRYFVNEYIFARNSSVEHTEFKRLALFKRHGEPAKLALTGHALNLAQTLAELGLNYEQVVTLHDFFGDAQNVVAKELHVEDLHLPAAYLVGSGNNFRVAKVGSQVICEIHFFGGTFGQVEHVDWYDQTGQLTMIQRYDLRGFKALEEFYGTKNGEKYYVRYYRPDGTVYLESYFVESTAGTALNSRLVLRDYQGQDYYFEHADELTAFFFDELNRQAGGQATFIADRPGTVVHPLLLMKAKRAQRFLWLATNHVLSGQDPLTAPFLGIYAEALAKQNLKAWTGILVPTAAQTAALRQRLGKKAKLYTLPSTSDPVAPAIPFDRRQSGLVIAVGRTGEDKGTSALIQAFATVHQALPAARLKIYGYGGDHEAYQAQIEAAGLQGVVELTDYVQDPAPEYDRAQLLVDASDSDNRPLAMGEALAHGLPVLSYDYPYGPRELVEAGVNGELVPNGDLAALTSQLLALLQAPDRLATLSQEAYARAADPQAEATLWANWQAALGID